MKDMGEALDETDLEDMASQTLEDSNGETQELNDEDSSFSVLKDIISSEPPAKPLESYQEHPLNFDGSESSGRIIKGMEGILTDLNKAVLLVVMGLVQKYQEKKPEKEEDNIELKNDGRDTKH